MVITLISIISFEERFPFFSSLVCDFGNKARTAKCCVENVERIAIILLGKFKNLIGNFELELLRKRREGGG